MSQCSHYDFPPCLLLNFIPDAGVLYSLEQALTLASVGLLQHRSHANQLEV